jgi:hypothetical protein
MSFIDGDLPSDAMVQGDFKFPAPVAARVSVSSSLSSVRSSHSAATPDAQQATHTSAFRWHFDPNLDVAQSSLASPVSPASPAPLASSATVASVTVDGRRQMDSPLVTPHIVAPSASDDVLRSLISSLRVQVQAARLENEQVRRRDK